MGPPARRRAGRTAAAACAFGPRDPPAVDARAARAVVPGGARREDAAVPLSGAGDAVVVLAAVSLLAGARWERAVCDGGAVGVVEAAVGVGGRAVFGEDQLWSLSHAWAGDTYCGVWPFGVDGE